MKKMLSLIVIVAMLTVSVNMAFAQDSTRPSPGTYLVAENDGTEIVDSNTLKTTGNFISYGTQVEIYMVTEQMDDDGNWWGTLDENNATMVNMSHLALDVTQEPINQPPIGQPAPQQDQPEWQLPTQPQDLPNALPAGASALQADMPACQSRMDMNEGCSTLEGQSVTGQFVVGETDRPELRLMNGDVIEITDAQGQPIFPRIPVDVSGTNHDMVLLYTTPGAEVVLHTAAEFGSNRQDFYLAFPRNEWGEGEVVGILSHQLRLALVESQPAEEACSGGVFSEDCYPDFINPRNCASVWGGGGDNVTYCDTINIYVFRWDGQTWEPMMYGMYGLIRNADGTATEAAYQDLRSRIPEFSAAAQ